MLHLKRSEGLNVVPFIDIMLVLLAIVLTVSTFLNQGKIHINIPKATSSEKNIQKKAFEILVNSENLIYVNDKEVSLDQLDTKLQKIEKDFPIILKSDENSKFKIFISIIDLLKVKEHKNFQIVVKDEK